LIDRTRKTFGTLARLEQYRGHFFNWYDTRSLKPLPPLYVSTVDSGNLVGHLLVLRGGFLELVETKVLPPQMLRGLRDTARVLLEVAGGRHEPEKKVRAPLVPAEVLRRIERLEGD